MAPSIYLIFLKDPGKLFLGPVCQAIQRSYHTSLESDGRIQRLLPALIHWEAWGKSNFQVQGCLFNG